jgi:hypothetical protein
MCMMLERRARERAIERGRESRSWCFFYGILAFVVFFFGTGASSTSVACHFLLFFLSVSDAFRGAEIGGLVWKIPNRVIKSEYYSALTLRSSRGRGEQV